MATLGSLEVVMAASKELNSELEDLVDAVEVEWRKCIDGWHDVRKPAFQNIMRHNCDQEELLKQNSEYLVEPQPELVQLHKAVPFDIWTDRRDKYGFITSLFVPQLGDDAVWDAPFFEEEVTPERFELLWGHYVEHLTLIRYTLSMAENRSTPVNL